ncbi:PREDICTED: serine/threonine-protein kinase-like protein CCR4 [Tarenaya hassleriana]|uniref:serine/threonine-protein kinase-like protein CCR4 n=1 Tax=Tarenaya hassleriana TaxID=28532 RepID=UPI00053C19B9|nr:PREDICTED: serine/threonine-protein kinase-like protein CCR4 [Tarenaya hassleriana]
MAFFVSDSVCPFWVWSLLALSSLSLNCSSLPTVSISETSNRTLICALFHGSSLRCSIFPRGSIGFPINDHIPNRTFAGVVSGNGFVCALISPMGLNASSVLCWRFSANGRHMSRKRIYQGPELEELEAGNSRICGIESVSRRLRCWQPVSPSPETYPNFSSVAIGENFLCGLSPSPGKITCHGQGIANAPSGDNNYAAIAAGFRHACAITLDNDVHCWGQTQGSIPPGEKFTSLALGHNRSCGLRLSNGTVVCWGSDNFSLPNTLVKTQFSSIEAKGRIFCGVTTANSSLSCWGNEDFELGVFAPFRTESVLMVLPGPCRRECPYGPLQGSERLCSKGFKICQFYRRDPSNGPRPVSPEPSSTRNSKNRAWEGRDIGFLVIGIVGSLSLILVIGFFLFKHCKNRLGCRVHDSRRLDETGMREQPKLEKRLSQLASLGNTNQLEEFSLDELARATDGFSVQSKIGLGSFGSVYHAVLADGRHVAIKRAETTNPSSYGTLRQKRDDRDKDTAFVNELESLSRLTHKNLVRLLGFYEDSNERVLVYEYMDNTTLSDHLHNPRFTPLTWQARVKIALDAARGIQYLHEFADPPVIHRDIKPSNILLHGGGASETAKVSDFGLSQIGPTGGDSHLSVHAAGTLGYIDPEYYRLQRLTAKSDVYSFGVVLLEILSGLKAIHKNEEGNPRNVVDFAVPYILQDEIHRILDRRIPPPTPYEIEAVASVGYLAAGRRWLASWRGLWRRRRKTFSGQRLSLLNRNRVRIK